MDTAIKEKTLPPSVLECWNKVKDWDNATKFEFGLMILNSLNPQYVASKQDEDAKFVEEYEKNLHPYTMDEINAMLDEAEAEFAAGKGIPGENVDREMEEELRREEAEEAARSYYYKVINEPLSAIA